MARAKYVLRLVIDQKVEAPARFDPSIMLPRWKLECGHLVPPPKMESTAEVIRVMGGTMAGTLKRRCFECANAVGG